MKKSYFFVGLLVAVVLAVSFVGSSWTTGYANTVPTLPSVPTIPSANGLSPAIVRVGGNQYEVTITGKNYIDPTNTVVRWLGPDLQYANLTTTSVSPDGKTLKAIVPAAFIHNLGTAYLWVVNHPGSSDVFEVAGPLNVNVMEMTYLPQAYKH